MKSRIVLMDPTNVVLGTSTVSGSKVLKVDVVQTTGGGGGGDASAVNQLSEIALLTTIDADTSTIAGAVSGTEMQVDVLTMPTTTVQATNLDIRDLVFASDKVDASGTTLGANSGVDIGDVTINNASGASAVNIQDGGNSITVDGSVTVSATNLDIRDLVAATDAVTIHGDVGVIDQFDLSNSNPAAVAIVDSNGDQITSFGGGTQYTEGDTDSSITGTAILWEDTSDTLRAVSAAKPLPIGDAGGSLTVDNGGTFAVQAAQSGTWDINNISGTISLPTGAATSANQSTIIGHVDGIEGLLTTIDADTSTIAGAVSGTEMQVDVLTMPTVTVTATNLDIRDLVFASDKVDVSGSTLGANSGVDIGDVTINNASGGSAVNIQDGGNSITIDGTVAATQSGTWDITNISGTISLPTGAATSANQSTIIGHVDGIEGLLTTIDADTSTIAGAVSGTEMQVDVLTMPVVSTTETKSSSCATSSVAGSASSVTLLSANSSRLGASIYNDSTAYLYIKCGATASTSSFQTKLPPDATWEAPFRYTGIIDGIWSSATGNARIGEFT